MAFSDLEEIVTPYRAYLAAQAQANDAAEMAAAESDPEMRAFLEDEQLQAEARADALRAKLEHLLVPKDPNDGKDLIVEIRAGAGGQEAALWAGELFEMYRRFAERHRLKTEVLASSPSELGGFKEVSLEVRGKDAYAQLKHESGVHRVQRVPVTESSGRIHTSTATVAVLPEAEEVEVELRPEDLRIEVYRSSGPGGQSVNTTDSAVRIVHLPTGIKIECQEERSQLQNKEKAMRYLRARLLQKAQDEAQAKEAAARRSQLGTGDRSEKIRTYNFPDGRVTDHRIKYTSHQLQDVLAGGEELDGFVDRLELGRARRAALGRGRGGALRSADETGEMTPALLVRRAADYLERHGVDNPRITAELLLAKRARGRPEHAGHPHRRTHPSAGEDLRTRVVPAVCGHAHPAPDRGGGVPAGDAHRASRRLHPAPGDRAPRRARPRRDPRPPRSGGRRRRHGDGRHRARRRRRAPGRPGVRRRRSPAPPWRSRGRTPRRSGSAIEVLLGDLLAPLPASLRGVVDVVVSNPPYVRPEEVASLPAEVLADPETALVGGIELVERLCAEAMTWLRPGGTLALEIGETQGDEVSRVVSDAGLTDARVVTDLTGRDRFVVARRP